MGGLLFEAGPDPLEVPRMRKTMYRVVKQWAQFEIMDHFTCIASPIEGPGKQDFGDIDILLAMPTHPFASKDEIYQTLAACLQPTRTVVDRGKDISVHFAVDFPSALTRLLKRRYHIESDDEEDEEEVEKVDAGSTKSVSIHSHDSNEAPKTPKGDKEKKKLSPKMPREHPEDQRVSQIVQIDIRLCDTSQQFQWMLFKHAHGDMWNILGTIIRPYGLTVDEEAMWLRIPEIEGHDRKRSKIRLTDDPELVLRFLGLQSGSFWEQPFKSVDAMFNYIVECRFFSTNQLNPSSEHLKLPAQLKTNDRRRMRYRPAYRKFVEEFLPKCRKEAHFQIEPYTRAEVKQLAFEVFPVKYLYEMRLREFRFEKQKDIVMKVIKSEVPEADPNDPMSVCYRSTLVKALRRIILDGDHRYGVIVDFEVMDRGGNYNVGQISNFIARHRIRVGRCAMEVSHANYVRFLQEKENKERAEASERQRRLERVSERAQAAASERAQNFF